VLATIARRFLFVPFDCSNAIEQFSYVFRHSDPEFGLRYDFVPPRFAMTD
jgi:hypothetical protein